MKVSTVLIEAEDLVELPEITLDVTRPGRYEVRWNLRAAEVGGISLREREHAHVAVTRTGQQRLRRVLERYGARPIFVGASAGFARYRGTPADVSEFVAAIRRELLRPGSLALEIHDYAYSEKEEEAV